VSARTDDTDSGASTSATAVISAQLKDSARARALAINPHAFGPTPSTKR